ncbi:cytochrome c [Gluconacetobacter tumulicola]|uniref:Cytochrome c n=1 Tax=Gluconacetobacter tumulicola TaxID=1017177 RepID=A0A7W4JDG5_9PROT|nr:cytochrome c [Gluconacetobacter tumulicola]MBB2179196.1 cytochrome c [Gluconacetobacter tumulicola]
MKKILTLALCLGAATPAFAAPDGQALYGANCGICHQGGGVGAPGQFPPLANRIDKIASTPEGKKYVTAVLMNGLAGSIDAAGATYVGFMPSFKSLSDDDVAAILTYLSSLGSTKQAPVITPADVAAARAAPMPSSGVAAARKALNAAHPLP